MKNIILFDDDNWLGLLPLTFTKPICELRVGILTIREKWEKCLNGKAHHITQSFLSRKYPLHIAEDNIIINSTTLPYPRLVELINDLEPNQALVEGDELIAARIKESQFENLAKNLEMKEVDTLDLADDIEPPTRIERPYHIFLYNDREIRKDIELLTKGRTSAPISSTNQVINPDQIFLEEGAKVEMSILNASTGPIYIGKNAEIMEGCMVRGPLAMCENSVLKMGAKVYGATTLGTYCKVGGEVSNVVFSGYSNKGHDGYLGNSVIGEWCNLGADTNSSNLKNNYASVKLWNYEKNRFTPTGEQFCGLIMGDHAKCGINTMFNTGTVVGVGANVFGSGFPRNFIPSFSWGGASGFSTYKIEKALETAEKVMARRKISLSKHDIDILSYVHKITSKHRAWENASS